MNKPSLFRKTEERTFFAHHMLLHAASLAIAEAEANELGRFNKCLSAMVMTALAVEALANAVGHRAIEDWATFERKRPGQKIDLLVNRLAVLRDETMDNIALPGWLEKRHSARQTRGSLQGSAAARGRVVKDSVRDTTFRSRA